MNEHNKDVIEEVIDMVKEAYGIKESVLGSFNAHFELCEKINDYLIPSIDVLGDHD